MKRIVLKCEGFAQKAQQKKKQNTLDMLAFMETRKEKMQEAIDLHLMALTDPEKISDAGLSQIATSFGIIVDKATKNTASGNDSLNKLDGLLKEFKDAVKSGNKLNLSGRGITAGILREGPPAAGKPTLISGGSSQSASGSVLARTV